MEPMIGQVIHFAGNFVPRGWALCDGRLLAIENHTALYSIIGNKYGGDGLSTFALPDFRNEQSYLVPKGVVQKESTIEKERSLNELYTIIAMVGNYPSKL